MNKTHLITAIIIASLSFSGLALASETPAPSSERPAGQGGKPGKPGRPDAKRPGFKECDKDGDKALNRAEFTACFPKRAERFDVIDANKDGKVTREEMQAAREAEKTERRRAFFASCDVNKDGQLSFDEFDACSRAHQEKMRKDRQNRQKPPHAPKSKDQVQS